MGSEVLPTAERAIIDSAIEMITKTPTPASPFRKRKHDSTESLSPSTGFQPPKKLEIDPEHHLPEQYRDIISKINDDMFAQVQKVNKELTSSIEFQDTLISTNLTKMAEQEKRIASLETQVNNCNYMIEKLRTENTSLHNKINKNETYSRRENLIFRNIPDSKLPPIHQIRNILYNMYIPDYDTIPIERCHLLRPANNQRQIIVRFLSFVDRERVWSRRNLLRGSRIHLMEDFPRAVEFERRELQAVVTHATTLPQFKNAKIVANKLHVNNRVYTTKTLDQLPKPINPKHTSVKENSHTVVFGGISSKHNDLSNYKMRTFTHKLNTFNSIEQAFQFSKCIAEGHQSTADQIMLSDHPSEMRSLGHKVKVTDIWPAQKNDVMYSLLKSKFTQHIDLKASLLSTGTKQIVEANATDMYWASGLPFTNIKNLTDKKLPGGNMLGIQLMKLRDELKMAPQ